MWKGSAWHGCLYERGHYVKEKPDIIFAGREIKLDLTVLVLLSISTRYDYARWHNVLIELGVFS
jgi:hypothetical protein